MRRLLPLFLMLFAAACAHTPAKPSHPAPPPLSSEAAGFFGRAAAIDTVGSVVIDFDELRSREILPYPSQERSVYADALINVLATAGSTLRNEQTGPLLARAAVLLSLMREWDAWPLVQRAGVMLPWLRQDNPTQSLMIVLAVPSDAATNATLLKGLAAADRATGKPLLAMREGQLCVGGESGPNAICGHAGPGYILFAQANAIPELIKPSSQPLPAPSFVRIHANVPTFGRGDMVMDWQNGVRTVAQIITAQPGQAERLEQTLQSGLQRLDQHRAETRAFLAPMVDTTKQNLAADPDAPAGLKQAATKISTDEILDPEGFYKELRQSLVVSRQDNQVNVQATVPEPTVRRLLSQRGILLSAATLGVLAAVAIPTFTKYQQRATESEARTNLKAACTAQRSYFAENDHYGKTFEEIGFAPEKGNRYTYCMAGRCLPCTAAGCFIPPPKLNPCLEMTREYANDDGSEGFLVCAVGDPKGTKNPDTLDVWTVTEDCQVRSIAGEP